MIALPSWSIPLLLQAVTVSSSSVPARGEQEVKLSLDAPAMVRLTATSSSGTRCTVVDQVRGPFASAGQVGRHSCELDLLVDQGTYKVRLESHPRGKGQVKVQAAPFTEQNPRPFKLAPGQRLASSLKPGQQASFWLQVGAREVPYLRVSGRNAGEVKLWRNGTWLEEAPLRRTTQWPRKAKAVHEWWLDRPLDAGDYLVTVYGTAGIQWSGGGENDALEVERGFLAGAVDRQFPFTLPESGVAAVQVPKGPIAALLTLKAAPGQPVELHAFDFGGTGTLESTTGRCRLEPKTLVPECSAPAGADLPHVLLVRGEPGTQGLVEWAPWGYSHSWRGGYYGAATVQLQFLAPRSDVHLVALHDLPADTDAAPLGCALEELRGDAPAAVLARDLLRIGEGEQLDREFNYSGTSAIVWFELAKAGRYRVSTKGGRKSRCELFKLGPHTAELKRLTESKPSAQDCNESLSLSPGAYQLSLYEGNPGVERLVIREDNQKTLRPVRHKASCLIPEVPLSTAPYYRLVTNRVGAVAARGLVLVPLPLRLDSPLHLMLDPGAKLTLPVTGGVVQVRGAGLACGAREATVGRDGECTVSPDEGAVKLWNPTEAPIGTTLFRPGQAPPLPRFEAWAPSPKPLLRVPLDAPTFFDFEREQSHSMVFDVDAPGLYHVTTQGLLSTQCRLRTPVVPSVAQDVSGGRGRNCLVAGYLRPGRYMLTVGTVGRSKGRGAVLMTRRAPKELSAVSADGEAFFRVAAGDLAQQKLSVKKPARYALSTTAQGVGVNCRLDDAEGWPVEPVPSSCTGSRRLKKGSYLWTQLPLTVDSMRRTKLERERPPVILKGNKAHAVNFFTWYRAELGRDGKDEFLFDLSGQVQLDVVLSDGMQGRIELLEGDRARAVEVIPPRVDPRERAREEAHGDGEGGGEEGGGGEGESYEPPPEEAYEPSEGEETGEGEESGEEDEAAQARAEARERARQQARERAQALSMEAQAVPRGPEGVEVTLPPGRYRLVTQHSKGNVGVSYSFHLSADALLPNMARTVPVPARLPLVVPADGTLRLRTRGEADVRCRLLRPDGSLVFQSSENGADWNCAAAEPVAAGRYTLLLESETQTRGETLVALALAPTEDKPAAKDGVAYELGRGVLRIPVPPAAVDAVHELGFSGKSPFSCGLEDPAGKVVWQRSRVTACTALVRPKTEAWKVRLWTTDGSAKLSSTLRTRAISASERPALGPAAAALVRLPRPGRYKTAEGVFCIPEGVTGPLRHCGPDASLERGGHVLSTSGAGTAQVSLEPLTVRVAAAATTTSEIVSRSPQFEGLEATRPSVFLLSATVGYGERAAPACGFEGGISVRALEATGCFAASGAGTSAVARLDAFAPDESPVPAEVRRRAVPVASATALRLGRQAVSWPGEAGVFSFPQAARVRAELVLPAGTWAVLLDGDDAVDLCAPGDDLRRCVFSTQGGRLLLTGPEPKAEVSVVQLELPVTRATLAGLYEDVPGAPGAVTLELATSAAERAVTVDGAVRCALVLSDGRRTAGCRGTVPANRSARLELEHGGGPFRALVHAPADERWARLGDANKTADKAAPRLEAARLVPLAGARQERTFTVEKDAVVRLRADSGVCGLLRGGELLAVDGLGQGCDVARLLSPGVYRAVVRPFGGQPFKGGLSWTAEPVVALDDGVGNEEWIAPGEVRLFRFDTAAPGKVGLGLQVRAESLDCAVYDGEHRPVGEGCQQYLSLSKGPFLLSVRQRPAVGAAPLRFRPVLLGLAGTREEVPESYLKDLFSRIGAQAPGSAP